jgi:hypothetical protein
MPQHRAEAKSRSWWSVKGEKVEKEAGKWRWIYIDEVELRLKAAERGLTRTSELYRMRKFARTQSTEYKLGSGLKTSLSKHNVHWHGTYCAGSLKSKLDGVLSQSVHRINTAIGETSPPMLTKDEQYLGDGHPIDTTVAPSPPCTEHKNKSVLLSRICCYWSMAIVPSRANPTLAPLARMRLERLCHHKNTHNTIYRAINPICTHYCNRIRGHVNASRFRATSKRLKRPQSKNRNLQAGWRVSRRRRSFQASGYLLATSQRVMRSFQRLSMGTVASAFEVCSALLTQLTRL